MARSSKLMRPDDVGLGGFDSHTLPPAGFRLASLAARAWLAALTCPRAPRRAAARRHERKKPETPRRSSRRAPTRFSRRRRQARVKPFTLPPIFAAPRLRLFGVDSRDGTGRPRPKVRRRHVFSGRGDVVGAAAPLRGGRAHRESVPRRFGAADVRDGPDHRPRAARRARQSGRRDVDADHDTSPELVRARSCTSRIGSR